MFNGSTLAYTNSCTVKRSTKTVNSQNQPIYSALATIASNVKCRLITKTGYRNVDGSIVTLSEHTLYAMRNTDIRTGDTITIGSRSFKVDYADTNPGNSNHHIECKLEEIET